MFAANSTVRAGPQLSPVSHTTQAPAPPVQRSLLQVGDRTIPQRMRLAPLLGLPGVAAGPVQRVILKAWGSLLSQRAPQAIIKQATRRMISPAPRREFAAIVKQPPHFKPTAAVNEARVDGKRAHDTARSSTHGTTPNAVVSFWKAQGAKVRTMEDKFSAHRPLWGLMLEHAPTDPNFVGLKSSGNGVSFWKNFTQTITREIPQRTETITKLNELGERMVALDRTAGALKGSLFERWALARVLTNAKSRIRIAKQGLMKQKRTSDGWDPMTQTLWDMKHYKGKLAKSANNDQARDYQRIVQKSYLTDTGKAVKAVNYLFPTQDAAKANQWLATQFGFGVYYVEEPATLKKYA